MRAHTFLPKNTKNLHKKLTEKISSEKNLIIKIKIKMYAVEVTAKDLIFSCVCLFCVVAGGCPFARSHTRPPVINYWEMNGNYE